MLSRRYELIVDLQNSWRSAFLRVFCFPLMWTKAERYRLRRWLLIQFKWNIYGAPKPVPLRYIDAMKTLGCTDDGAGLDLAAAAGSESHATTRRVVLCPGAKHATKRWPIEYWTEVARQLTADGYDLIVCGAESEAEECRQIAMAGGQAVISAPLRELTGIMRSSEAVITHDSGLMHLAVGSGTRVLAIFGPTIEEFGF
ncbi:MAG: glycosyltransferase family 9 protein [bacterium]|nr:glycosyltransferase family 9 protein [bacterium]